MNDPTTDTTHQWQLCPRSAPCISGACSWKHVAGIAEMPLSASVGARAQAAHPPPMDSISLLHQARAGCFGTLGLLVEHCLEAQRWP